MKAGVSVIAAFLVGSAVAAGMSGGAQKRAEAVAATNGELAAREESVDNMFNMKFEAVEAASGDFVFRENIHGTAPQIRQFVSALNLSQLKQILGSAYGYPFRLNFYDINNGAYLGYLAGYFTASGGVSFDQGSSIAGAPAVPAFKIQPNLAPDVVKVTVSGSRSAQIIDAGKVTDSMLHDILGNDYGKPFKLTLTDDGDHVGTVSGSFSANGVQFSADNMIPGKKTSTKEAPAPSTTVEPPKPTDAPSDANTGSVTIDGGSDSDIKSNLNSLSYDYILKAVNGKYGPFYITFSSADGSLQGYIKGKISKSSYSYEWKYTYKQ